MDTIARKTAKAHGLPLYFTGKPCKNGHIAQRRVGSSDCLECVEARRSAHYKNNKAAYLARAKTWTAANRVKANTAARKWKQNNQAYYSLQQRRAAKLRRKKNPEKARAADARNRQRNHSKVLAATRVWRANNKSHVRAYARQYLTLNFNLRLRLNLRNRLNVALKRNTKAGSAVRDLGCSIEFLKLYLAKQFAFGMTWANYGKVWEIDHIEPLCAFDLTARTDFVKVVHYTNLQPLFKLDNSTKIVEDLKKKKKSFVLDDLFE